MISIRAIDVCRTNRSKIIHFQFAREIINQAAQVAMNSVRTVSSMQPLNRVVGEQWHKTAATAAAISRQSEIRACQLRSPKDHHRN